MSATALGNLIAIPAAIVALGVLSTYFFGLWRSSKIAKATYTLRKYFPPEFSCFVRNRKWNNDRTLTSFGFVTAPHFHRLRRKWRSSTEPPYLPWGEQTSKINVGGGALIGKRDELKVTCDIYGADSKALPGEQSLEGRIYARAQFGSDRPAVRKVRRA